mgnify:CR=1 FL=1
MQTYANALLIAIPFFVVFILVETFYGVFTKKQTFNNLDTISSLSSGVTNVVNVGFSKGISTGRYPINADDYHTHSSTGGIF